jgi:hypothetical protein
MQGGLAKNDSNEAGFQSLQISRSDLLDETQFVATANDRRLDPTDPKNTQESETGLRNDGLPSKTTILLVDARAALKLNDLNLPQPPDRALKEQP